MIDFANSNTTPIVRQMWKTCFGDTDEYIDLLFTKKYREENTLIYFEGETATASLQMLPYKISFYGESVPFYYLAGLCTLPEYRRKGHMEQLIFRSYEVMKERNIPLAILVPAEEWLFGFYEKYGFQQISDSSEYPIESIKKILDTTADLKEAYQVFGQTFNKKDFIIQKGFEDFEAIVEDSKMEDYPSKYNLASMGYIIDAKYMLNIFAKHNKNIDFTIKITNDLTYHIADGSVKTNNTSNFDFEADSQFLTRLLFGYKTDELDEPFSSLFPAHEININLMLE